MPELSSIGGALGRLAGRRAGRTRLVHATWSAASVAVRSVWRVLHLLFLEVTGFLFLCFTVVFGGVAIREYHKYSQGEIGPGKAALGAAFTVMFFWFGVSSFWRARRKRAKA